MVKRFIIAICFVMLLAGGVFAADTAIQVDALIPGMEMDGNPISGGKVYTYVTGTTTTKDTFLDRNKVATATNPVILDSEGRAEIYADGLYKFVIKDADDVTILTMDGLSYGVSTAPIFTYLSQYSSLSDAVSSIGVTPTVLVIDVTDVLVANVSVPATITLMTILQNAIDVDTYTLTLNCGIWSGPYQWIIGTGIVTGSPVVDYYNSTWIIGTVTDSTTPSYEVITIGEPVLQVPVIADFSNATHAHSEDSTGGLITFSIRDSSRGLKSNKATAVSVAMEYTELILQDTSGASIRDTNYSDSIAITASGLDGLDTGSEAADTWYYIWIIGNVAGDVGALFSVSSTAPTMPSGYTYKALIGAVYNDSGSDFDDFEQRGPRVNALRAQVAAVADFSSGTYTAKDISAFIPATATVFYGDISVGNAAGISRQASIAFDGTNGLGVSRFLALPSSTSYSNVDVAIEGQSLDLTRTDASITVADLFIIGWEY